LPPMRSNCTLLRHMAARGGTGTTPQGRVEERMDIRQITLDYSVAPQIEAEDFPALREAGFTDVICNRPDDEIGPDQQSERMRVAATEAGLSFHFNPVTNGGLTRGNLTDQAGVLADATGPVLAYCRSGTRSTIVWALSQAGNLAADDMIGAAFRAGYDISGLRPQLESPQD